MSLWFVLFSSHTPAQPPTLLKPPDPGYVFPPGAKAGTTTDVRLGGYDWTPDVQVFALDPRVKLEPAGPPGPILVPPPPYWFGPKGTAAPQPLPREMPAKLTLPADLPPGPVRWATASASGAGPKTGILWVGDGPEVMEATAGKTPQALPALPVTVNGRLGRIEEVDRYTFTAAKDGPVTCEVFARRLGVNVNAAVTVRDSAGSLVADAVDTDGHDLALTFAAKAGTGYTVELHDLDFRGDRSFVYRLALTPGPRVVATVPAVGKRGETGPVEFVGYGVATGQPRLESVVRPVAFPTDPRRPALAYKLETAWGTAPAFDIPLSDTAETVAGPGPASPLTPGAAVTGLLDANPTEARFPFAGKAGDVWDLSVGASRFGSPLDVALAVVGPDGKERARNDDLPGTTDAGLTFAVPADGAYTAVVTDVAGRGGSRAAVYRLAAAKPAPGFALQTAARLNVPLGGATDLAVTATRVGGFKGPIRVSVAGLPAGVTAPADLVILEGKTDLAIPVKAAADAASLAGLLTVRGTADTPAGPVTQTALAPVPGGLATRPSADERAEAVVFAVTLKPRLKLAAVEADGGRKVSRGSTHPAEVALERLDGFAGEVSLQMAATQSYQRQGINGPDLVVPPGQTRPFYPCFMPEWLETTRTSRMALVGVVRVTDPKGRERHLVAPMTGQITMSIEGSLLKVAAAVRGVTLAPGETVSVPVSVLRSAKLTGPVRLELLLPDDTVNGPTAEPVVVAPDQSTAVVRITAPKGTATAGPVLVTIRGTAHLDGKWVVASEATVVAGR